MSGAVVHRKLRFGPFELSIGERVLRRDGQVLPLGGRALDILICLADRPGEIIAKQELIDHVWWDVTVEEGEPPQADACVRGGKEAWVRALSPDRDRSGLEMTGNGRLAETVLDALSAGSPDGGAQHETRVAA